MLSSKNKVQGIYALLFLRSGLPVLCIKSNILRHWFPSNIKMALWFLLIIFYFTSSSQADNTLHSMKYTVQVLGIEEEKILNEFNSLSSLVIFANRPLYSVHALKKRICEDHKILTNLMTSYGYFESEVELLQEENQGNVNVIFQVNSGARYKIKKIALDFGEHQNIVCQTCPHLLDDIPIQDDAFVEGKSIYESVATMTGALSYCGYPFAILRGHSIDLDVQNKQASIYVHFDPGKYMMFGDLEVKGNKAVPTEFIINRVPWGPGQLFDKRKLDKYRSKLSKSRLFDSVVIEYPTNSEQSEELPVTVSVGEKKPRTISTGLKYSINEGPGATMSWVHHNFTGHADRFESILNVAPVKSKFGINHEMPDFWGRDKTLGSTAEVIREDTEAYDSISLGASAVLRVAFCENDEYFYGLSFDHDRVKEHAGDNPKPRRTGQTLGVPLGVKFDTRDSILDPLKGYIINLTLTPKFGKIGNDNFLAKTTVNGSTYYTVFPKLTIAGWARCGSLIGINFNDVLANQRFYSGGGGSVRGYGYQLAGPLDRDGDPIGGKSVVEAGIETRLRFNEDWGGVAFIEASHVSQNTSPSFSEDILYGAGIGIRYYTGFGPIRADIATPLKRRRNAYGKKVDDLLQFYISIGQSF